MPLASRLAVLTIFGALVADHGVRRSVPSFPGAFIHATAVREDAAARDCLSLGENLFMDDVREVGVCRATGVHHVDSTASRDWSYGTYARRWLLTPADTVDEVEVVLFSSLVARAGSGGSHTELEPIWHYRYETENLRSVTPEVVDAGRAGALIAIDECVNGTGGCAQSFATFDDGKGSPVALTFLDSLNRRFPDAIRHGFHVDIRTLRGSVALYFANDANCCPSMRGEFTLRLQGNALELASFELRRVN